MDGSAADLERLPSALMAGRVAAVVARSARDLTECAARYPALFPRRPFDPALYNLVALANASCAPWLGPDDLTMANRTSIWAFAVDWLIDYEARSAAQVRDVVDRCLAVVDGHQPALDDPIALFLAEIHADLASRPAYPALGGVWREQFRLMLESMAREWDWRHSPAATALPTVEDYLDNADNICFSWVFVSHWLAGAGPHVPRAHQIVAAGRHVQRVIRVLNDLGTYDRDVSWGEGDLNVLMLGPDRAAVVRLSEDLASEAREALAAIRDDEPRTATFLDRYIDFNRSYYAVTDYWGKL